VPRPDGRLTALEVVVFPEAMRGTDEGHYAWDLIAESTMTNPTVYKAEAEAGGRVLTLRYPQGETAVVVPPDAPVVSSNPGTRACYGRAATCSSRVRCGAPPAPCRPRR
jgi:hypothetical protein